METLIRRYVRAKLDRGEFNPRSVQVCRSHLRSFADSTTARPDRISRRTVEAWMATPGLSPAYRRSRLSTLRGFCQWACLEGHMRRDPTIGLRSPTVPKGLPRALPADQSARLVAECHDIRTRLIVMLMLQEGLRRCEVSRALRPDLDLRRMTLAVRGKGGGGQPTRTVPISLETGVTLTDYLDEQPVMWGPLIRSRRDPDLGLEPATISELVLHVMRAAGVKAHNGDGRSAHALRHTMATDMLDRADIRQVQAALGHATIRTTEVYLRNQVAGLREAMAGRTYKAGVNE
jgi:integrase